MIEPGTELAASHPVLTFFAEHFSLGDDRNRTRAWCARVLAIDA
jgi:hypothetical protein